VDFDFYQPIKTALDFLHTVMPRGAKIVIDDYDFFSTGAKTAVQEFLDAHRTENAYAMFTPNTQFGYFTILTKCV
jgi:O-methyltransferase